MTQAVLNRENVFVQGIAGTGKTHYMLGLAEQLKSPGKKVNVITKTHTASARADGCTADHYVWRCILHGACTTDMI